MIAMGVVLLLAASCRAACPAPRVEISATIIMMNDIEWQYGCHTQLLKMKSLGMTRVNFIPTHMYLDNNDDNIPDSFQIRHGGNNYNPSAASIAAFAMGMAGCLQKAVNLGFDWIEITPHLDDANGVKWRNLLKLDPFSTYGTSTRFSYLDIMLDPIIEGLKNLKRVPASTQFHFSLQVSSIQHLAGPSQLASGKPSSILPHIFQGCVPSNHEPAHVACVALAYGAVSWDGLADKS
jgi:hypothetical protein